MKGIFHPSDTSQIDGERQEFLRPTSTKMKDVYRLEESASGKILSFRRCVGRDGRSVAGWLKHRGTTTRMVRGETWSFCAKLLVAAVGNDVYFSMSEDHAIPHRTRGRSVRERERRGRRSEKGSNNHRRRRRASQTSKTELESAAERSSPPLR